MNRPEIELVFGRSRVRMPTGPHVEVFREQSPPGTRRRYTKRFLGTEAGDLREWTEREERILTRVASLGIAPALCLEPFDRGAFGRLEQLRTYDAGPTVDQWASLLPVVRDGKLHRHVFEDRAHWWALARHCLIALERLHEAGFVHLDLKADNVCIPAVPEDFDPAAPGASLALRFEDLALIDFAFSLAPDEDLDEPLPLAGQAEYVYQSPRLLVALEAGRNGELEPTRALDWRCDLFSLAAMLRRYLPASQAQQDGSWTSWHLELARTLLWRLHEAHDAPDPATRPHRELLALTKQALADAGVSASLGRGWSLASEVAGPPSDLAMPLTRVVLPAGTSAPRQAGETPAQAHWAAPTPSARRASWAGRIAMAAISVPVLGAAWWAMQSGPPGEQKADAALAGPADAASAASSLSRPAPPAVAPTVAAAAPMPLPAPRQAPASAPIEQAPPPVTPMPLPQAPTASAVAATATGPVAPAPAHPPPAAAPRPAPAVASRANASTSNRRSGSAAASPADTEDRPWVDQAERERALRWLTLRGAAPRPGMTMPPAPAPASSARPAKADPRP